MRRRNYLASTGSLPFWFCNWKPDQCEDVTEQKYQLNGKEEESDSFHKTIDEPGTYYAVITTQDSRDYKKVTING